MIGFFALAYAWTWLWQAPLVLGYQGPMWLGLLALAAIGPSLAAVVMTRGRLLRRLRPRARWWWYGLALAVPVGVRAASLGVDGLLGNGLPAGLLAAPALGVMILPALGEELGWRGYAYPRLADASSPALAAVVTGALWGLWHLPTALLPGASLADFPLYLAMVTAGGIWLAWLYEASGRCVVVAIAGHAAINAGVLAHGSRAAMLIVWTAAAIASLWALTRTGRRARTRGTGLDPASVAGAPAR